MICSLQSGTDSLGRGGAIGSKTGARGESMKDMGIDLASAKSLFVTAQDDPYVLIQIHDQASDNLIQMLPPAFRQFYVDDDELERTHVAMKLPKSDLVRLKLPDHGSTMSGDFGEMLTSVMQAALQHPGAVIDPKKWRYKQDRKMPAPKSDVVQFLLPSWPDSSEQDRLVCAEVKTKAIGRKSTPIEDAIKDSQKDQDGRLASTLTWLRERSIFHTEVELVAQINRFIQADAHPQAEFSYRAVAVISADLVAQEVVGITAETLGGATLIVVSVPQLKQTYSAVFEAISETVAEVAAAAAAGTDDE
jgi:hypothetical protein